MTVRPGTENARAEWAALLSERSAVLSLDRRSDWMAWAAGVMWRDGAEVLALIDAAEAFEKLPDKWSDGDERDRLRDALEHFTSSASAVRQ